MMQALTYSFDSDVMILSQITQKQRQGLHLAILLLLLIIARASDS